MRILQFRGCVFGSEFECLFAGRRSFVHGVCHNLLADSAQPSGTQLVGYGCIYNKVQNLRCNTEFDSVYLEHLFILPHDGIFRFGENPLERISVKVIQICDYRKPSDYLRDESVCAKVLCLNILQKVFLVHLLFAAP